jgi:hypothetical protein
MTSGDWVGCSTMLITPMGRFRRPREGSRQPSYSAADGMRSADGLRGRRKTKGRHIEFVNRRGLAHVRVHSDSVGTRLSRYASASSVEGSDPVSVQISADLPRLVPPSDLVGYDGGPGGPPEPAYPPCQPSTLGQVCAPADQKVTAR